MTPQKQFVDLIKASKIPPTHGVEFDNKLIIHSVYLFKGKPIEAYEWMVQYPYLTKFDELSLLIQRLLKKVNHDCQS